MTNNTNKAPREPLFHVTKRAQLDTKKAILIRAVTILAGLIFASLVVMVVAKANPIKVIGSLFSGAFGTTRRIWNLLNETVILLGIALALTPAFKMKFWNCGGEGQTLIGALAAASCMFLIGDSIPVPILFLVMILSSILAGAIWGLIPAVFKSLFGTNETLFTLMMNYIATQVVSFFLKLWIKSGSGVMPTMPQFRFPKLFGQDHLLTIVVFIALSCMMYVYFKYSKQGYEISVVGESEKTAQYIGINVKKVIIRTMILSGAICGLVGLFLVANGSCTVATDIVGGRGFTAIMISWLAKFNPFIMILASLLVAILTKGSSQISTDLRLPSSTGDIITAILLLFIIGCEFFINYKINFRSSAKEGTK